MAPRPQLRTFGDPGFGLKDPTWKVDGGAAKVGLGGEIRTAEVPARLPAGAVVFHDLRIPIPDVKANIDHLVVFGQKVWIIDSKVWRAGFYATVAGRSYRMPGVHRFDAAEKHTMEMATRGVTALLTKTRVMFDVVEPTIVVWPSGAKTPNVRFLRFPGAETISGARFERRIKRFRLRLQANETLVEAILPLVNGGAAAA